MNQVFPLSITSSLRIPRLELHDTLEKVLSLD
jgi:hypothetical protein